MSTRHLVEPQTLPVLDAFERLALTEDNLVEVRALGAENTAKMASQMPQYPNIEVLERIVPGPDGAPDVRVLVYTPKNRQGLVGGLLWIHGGGYIIGSVEGADAEVKTIVDRVGCVVVSVDYRLAPETRAPGAAEDCYAALKWFHQNAAELGVDPSRLAIGGDSAGGGLTAALGLITRDRGEIKLALQVLIYPMLDDRTVTNPDPNPYVGEFVWTPELNHLGWKCHLGQEPGSEGISYYAAPARAEDLSGLPPTFISVGSLDLFLEEDIEYARRLMRAGVPTELHVYPGGFHGYMMAAESWIAKAYYRDYQGALDRALNPR
jgi:acetyl esterase/lipase